MEDDLAQYLEPTFFLDCDHPRVRAFAEKAAEGATTDIERAARLFRTVRDAFRYDPYTVPSERAAYRASAILEQSRAFCIPKAIVLVAAARALGIPARLGFADVKNHLSSEQLRAAMGTDLFIYHGYADLFVGGRWVKATPAFNASLCDHFGVPPLELDGVHDAMLQATDAEGRQQMEYVLDRGTYADLPFDDIARAFVETYGEAPPSVGDEAFEVD